MLLIGRDGSAVALRGAETKIVLPTNQYRIRSLTTVVSDPSGGKPWGYTFSTTGSRWSGKWYVLEAGRSLKIRPFRDLQMKIDLAGGKEKCTPGDLLVVTPRLHTPDGLATNTCWRGDRRATSDEAMAAEVRLEAADGTLLARSQSGFA